MRKIIIAFGVLASLSFGVFGQVLGARVVGYLGRENLVLLWINALELSQAQMKDLLKLVDEVLPLRDEIVNMQEKFHEDLLKFTGTARELRELLGSYQKELREKLQTLEEKFTSGLKKILTVSQWERLQHGLLGGEENAPRSMRPRAWVGPERKTTPLGPAIRMELRGLTLVRLLPDLREALIAKLAALEK
ncbi:MAG: hypothetical protein NZ651_04560 [Candidatus Bipolaricaulota bacterium]|nr:hypothetical protein [Candidatus Bipolaricaulota bacterium]MDW8127024.1 hypothetical protein [Candidatus Bipolaricaulota bacterium]